MFAIFPTWTRGEVLKALKRLLISQNSLFTAAEKTLPSDKDCVEKVKSS